jgi:antitoxin HicB
MKRKENNGLSRLSAVRYFARLRKQRNDGYLVEFPDLPGCLTEGETLEEALSNAREALSGWLYVSVLKDEDVPKPKAYSGRGFHEVAPDLDVVVPLLILWIRRQRNLTQQQMAQSLGISQQAYRKLEIPGKSNPTLRTLARLFRVMGLSAELRLNS